MKKCRVCSKEKEVTDFHKSKSSKDGMVNICRSCVKIKNKKVCGLHTLANLQILDAVENLRKNNKFEV